MFLRHNSVVVYYGKCGKQKTIGDGQTESPAAAKRENALERAESAF